MAVPKNRDFASKIMIPAVFHCSTSLQTQFCQKNISCGNVFLINPVNRIPIVNITARLLVICCSFLLLFQTVTAQDNTLVFKDAITANRTKTYNNIVKNIITKNLSLPLTDSTEENWQDAFYALEVLQYKQPWVLQKVKAAFDEVQKRSSGFQRALLEFVYTNYQPDFVPQVAAFAQHTINAKLLSMCAEYIFANNQKEKYSNLLHKQITQIKKSSTGYDFDPFFIILLNKLSKKNYTIPALKDFFNKNYLAGQTLAFSLQRKNRNYAGMAIVRDSIGNFILDSVGNVFNVPQLARSITNMPGYITNGNTPQGIFKITGFDVSKSSFIGPTTNMQLLLPFEKSSTIPDSVSMQFGNNYTSLLPKLWQQYFPVYEAFYAGLAGRSEIIAHGTTVDLNYYKGQTYWPHTPTQGCLCTKEIWSGIDGKRTVSDQQKLVDAVKKAGGANGYLIVIEIDDQQKPVTINEILPYLKQAQKK